MPLPACQAHDEYAIPRNIWVSAVVGLAVAAIVSALSSVPGTGGLSPGGLFTSAGECVLATFFASALTIRAFFVFNRRVRQAKDEAWRIAAAGTWFAPFWIFLQERSVLSLVAAMVLAGALTFWFYAHRLPSVDSGTNTAGPAAPPFSTLDQRLLLLQLFPALCISLLAEGTILATTLNWLWLALLLSCGFAVLLASCVSTRIFGGQLNRESTETNTHLLVGLAILFSIIGLSPYVRKGGGGDGNVASSRSTDQEKWRVLQGPYDYSSTPGSSAEGEAYPGIILWPKEHEPAQLIAPAPHTLKSSFRPGRRPVPLEIPFDGVYWFFRWPEKRPSRRAYVASGTPQEHDIRSTSKPLLSEARQNLGTLVDFNCCGELQLVINDADPYPGTVSIEVILQNTSLPGKPVFSLGTEKIGFPPRHGNANTKPITEVLNFPFSSHPDWQRFDEIHVVFHLSMQRALVAARMGVQKFVLVPRGM